jgi:transposase InsO family protein
VTRSARHRWLQRHGITRIPDMGGEKRAKKKVKSSAIGYVHLDSAEGRTEEGKLYLCVALDRAGQCADAERHEEANQMVAAQVLRHVMAAVPYTIHTVLTENGMQFTNRKRAVDAFHHIFDRVCQEQGIAHRLTKTNPPWTNGQVERLNRTRTDATVQTYPD